MATQPPSRQDDRIGVRTYLTPEEAKDFHKLFMLSFIIFTLIAIVAHFLVWQWRPWLPGPNGYAAISAPVNTASADATATHS